MAWMREEVEALLEAFEQGLWREDVDACGGKFDGKGKAIKVFDDLFDGSEFLVVGLPTRAESACAIEEELNGLICGERWERDSAFADDLELFARGDKKADEGFFLRPASDGGECVGGDLLEVVEDDQGLAATMKRVADLMDVLFGFTRVKGDAEGLGDGLEHLGEGITFAEIAKPDPSVELVDLLEAKVLCEAGFPCTTRAEKGDKPFAACVGVLEILEFLVSSDKAFVERADVGLLELGSR